MKKYQFGHGEVHGVHGVHGAHLWAKWEGEDAIYMAIRLLGGYYGGPGDHGYGSQIFWGLSAGLEITPCWGGVAIDSEDTAVLEQIEAMVADMAAAEDQLDHKAAARRTTKALKKERRHSKWQAQLKS